MELGAAQGANGFTNPLGRGLQDLGGLIDRLQSHDARFDALHQGRVGVLGAVALKFDAIPLHSANRRLLDTLLAQHRKRPRHRGPALGADRPRARARAQRTQRCQSKDNQYRDSDFADFKK